MPWSHNFLVHNLHSVTSMGFRDLKHQQEFALGFCLLSQVTWKAHLQVFVFRCQSHREPTLTPLIITVPLSCSSSPDWEAVQSGRYWVSRITPIPKKDKCFVNNSAKLASQGDAQANKSKWVNIVRPALFFFLIPAPNICYNPPHHHHPISPLSSWWFLIKEIHGKGYSRSELLATWV